MTPVGAFNPVGRTYWCSHVFHIDVSGYIDDNYATNPRGLRPVINIKKDVTITGTGTIDNPYKVSL